MVDKMTEFANQLEQTQLSTDPNAQPVTPVADPATTVQPVVQPPGTEPVSVTPPAVEPAAEPPAQTPVEPAAEVPWFEQQPSLTTEPPAQTPAPVNPELQFVTDYLASGKTLQDLVSEYKVENYDQVDDREIFKRGVEKFLGITGQDLEDSLAEFDTMSAFERRKHAQEFRAKFSAGAQDVQSKLSAPFAARKEQETQILTRFSTELQAELSSVSGKEYRGLTITPEMAQQLQDHAFTKFGTLRPDGSVDVQKILDFSIWELFGPQLVKANVTKFKNLGRQEVLEQVTNPNANPSASPVTNPVADDLEAALAAMKSANKAR